MNSYDPYVLLDLKQGCTLEDIKAAWKKAAQTYHPDRNTTEAADLEFSKRYKAYKTLLKTHEDLGVETFGVEIWVAPKPGKTYKHNPFRSIPGPRFKGENLYIALYLTEQAAKEGGSVTTYTSYNVPCFGCKGLGGNMSYNTLPCGLCQNTGVYRGLTCRECLGNGRKPTVLCPACKGSGSQKVDVSVMVNWPVGSELNQTLEQPLKGAPGTGNATPGSLYVELKNISEKPPHYVKHVF